MKAKLLPYKLTCLFGVAFLGSLLWSGTFPEGFTGFVFVLLFFLSFLVSTIVSVGLALARKSRQSFYPVAINAVIILLLFPTINLGRFLRDRVSLMRLPEFQEATDFLIKSEKAQANREGFSTLVPLPPLIQILMSWIKFRSIQPTETSPSATSTGTQAP